MLYIVCTRWRSRTIREVAREKTDLSEEELDKLLDARKMTEV